MIYNAYTNTNDYPELTDFPANGYTLQQRGVLSGNPTPFQLMSLGLTQSDQGKQRAEYTNAINAWLAKYNLPVEVQNEWARAESEQRLKSTQDIQSFWQRMKEKYKTFVQNTGGAITELLTNAGGAVKDALSVIGENVSKVGLTALYPLKPAMRKGLAQKGYRTGPSDSLEKVTAMFYNHYVLGKNKFESSNYENLGEEGATTTASGSEVTDVLSKIPPELIPQIVSAIMLVFRKITEKLKRGEKLTAEEQALNDEMNKGIENLPPTEPPVVKTDWMPLLKGIGTALLIYAGYKFFTRKKG